MHDTETHMVHALTEVEDKQMYTTMSTPKTDKNHCSSQGLRVCSDGSCISRLDLCPEEEKVNENTILIMIIIGIAVIIAMVILYCFQQRSRRLSRSRNTGALETIVGDGDNASLDNPPPAYDEVIGSNLYLPTSTPRTERNGMGLNRIPSAEEPMTPPPNYDAALVILAQSHESFFLKRTEEMSTTSVIRRSVSTETNSPASPTARSPTSPTARSPTSPTARSPTSPTARSPTSVSRQHFDFRRTLSVNAEQES